MPSTIDDILLLQLSKGLFTKVMPYQPLRKRFIRSSSLVWGTGLQLRRRIRAAMLDCELNYPNTTF